MEKDGVIRFQKAHAEFNVSTSKDMSGHFQNDENVNNRYRMEKRDAHIGRHQVLTQPEQVEVRQFDVFERQGFDRIIQAVAQSTSEKEKIAKSLCETLEAFTSLFYEM